jgi:hypothetical protein
MKYSCLNKFIVSIFNDLHKLNFFNDFKNHHKSDCRNECKNKARKIIFIQKKPGRK